MRNHVLLFLKLTQKRCRCPKNHLLFVLLEEILFIYVSNELLIARYRREDPKRIQVGQFYGPTVKNTFAIIIFTKMFQKIGGHELIARNRREDTKRIQVGQFYGPTVKNTFAAIIFKKIVSKKWRRRANSKK